MLKRTEQGLTDPDIFTAAAFSLTNFIKLKKAFGTICSFGHPLGILEHIPQLYGRHDNMNEPLKHYVT